MALKKNTIVVYLNYLFFENKKELEIVSLEEFSKTIVLILETKYNIKIDYDYTFNIYENLDYGIIIEIIENTNEDEVFLGISDQIININYFGNTKILYVLHNFEILNEEILKNNKLINKNNKIYLEITNKFSKKDFMQLIEHSDIIYEKEDITKILRK